ncbi:MULTISPECIES: aldo/keto reductase [unclassified Lacinutrix]
MKKLVAAAQAWSKTHIQPKWWHNKKTGDILKCAFDLGITHFDLANNYGPPYGSAEKNFGKIFKKDFKRYRDELFISTKAGYDMWLGPYGNCGSRKYLISSLDQSLKRMKLDYVDVFYHHRPDPNTPLEETMGALADIVRQEKALYVGISNYKPEETKIASKLLKDLKVPFIVNQVRSSILEGWVEDGLLETLIQEALGCIAFSPLAQGMLTDKNINGVPPNSRAAKESRHLDINKVNATIDKVKALNTIAEARDQKLSQMAISWLLNKPEITSVLIRASSTNQLKENVKALDNINF